MANDTQPKYVNQLTQDEHDNSIAPFTKRVSLYGWDPVNLKKIRIATNSDGELLSSKGARGLLFDFAGGSNPIYIGSAEPGTATSAASWLIKKLSYDGSGNIASIQFAGGSANPTNVWDNRASLSYS